MEKRPQRIHGASTATKTGVEIQHSNKRTMKNKNRSGIGKDKFNKNTFANVFQPTSTPPFGKTIQMSNAKKRSYKRQSGQKNKLKLRE